MTRSTILAERDARLAEFCAKYEWTLHTGSRSRCSWLMLDPRHRCQTRLWCTVDYALRRYPPSVVLHPSPKPNFDHTKLLRRGSAARPDQWAILSQTYNYDDPTGLAWFLGPAPYGEGTHALLYPGLHVNDPRRLIT